MTNEREIENILEAALRSKGWHCDAGSKERDVFHQGPRSDDERKKLGALRPDFCLYLRPQSPAPEVVVETKKLGMNLAKAKSQAAEYARVLGSKIIILFNGLETKTYWADSGEPLLFDGAEVNALRESEFYRKFVAADSNVCMSSAARINSKEDLIAVFAFANQKLRKAGITKGMERFFEFSNLLFLKLVSETNDIVSGTIPAHVKWEAYKHKTGDELLSYINDVVIPHLERIFNTQGEKTLFSPLIIKDTASLAAIIEHLDKLCLAGIKTDIKGDAFEYFIQQYNNTNNDLGEYFTPRHIVNFLVRLAAPKYGEKIYDPFCGTGGMLISSFNYIKDSLLAEGYLTENVLKDIKENTVWGGEISSNARIAKMNMILAGDGHSNIRQQDSLQNPCNDQFDIVITNIPFNLEGTAGRLYPLFSDNGNAQSIQHVVLSLKKKPASRAFVIVPEAVLNNRELKTLRRWLLDKNLLKQIISLPSGVFLPYTEAKASILVL